MNVKLTKAQQQLRIGNGKALFEVMRSILRRDDLFDRGKEHFWVVGLDHKNLLLYVELISLGSTRATVVEPMEIFRWALQKDSARIILVHNHPRGTLTPSVPDVELTAHMYQVGELLELPVIDHLIISEKAFYSFAEGGLMAELAQTKKYLLSSAAQEKLKAEARALGEKAGREAGKVEGIKVGEAKGLKAGQAKGRLEGEKVGVAKGRQAGLKEGREAEKLQVAQVMKAKGIAVSVIAEVTGLSVARVKGLAVSKAERT